MPAKPVYASRALKEAHAVAKGLHKSGLITDTRMAEFDAMCLPQSREYSPEQIKALRHRYGKTQSELAAKLGISLSTLRQWEIGAKKPSTPSQKLLYIIDRHGLELLS